MEKNNKKREVRKAQRLSNRKSIFQRHILTKRNINRKKEGLETDISKKDTEKESSLLRDTSKDINLVDEPSVSNTREELKSPYRPLIKIKKNIFLRAIDYLKKFINSSYISIRNYLEKFNNKIRDGSIIDSILAKKSRVSSHKSRLDVFIILSFIVHLIIFLPFFNRAIEPKERLKETVSVKLIEPEEVVKKIKKEVKKAEKKQEPEKKAKTKRIEVAKKTLSEPLRKKTMQPKKVLSPKKEKTEKVFDKPKPLNSKATKFTELPQENRQFKFLKADRTDIEKKKELSRKIPDRFLSKEALEKPITPALVSDLKNKTDNQNPKTLVSKTSSFEKRFQDTKNPPLTSKINLTTNEISTQRIDQKIPEKFRDETGFEIPIQPAAALSPLAVPKRLDAAQPQKSYESKSTGTSISELEKLASQKASGVYEMRPKGSSKDVVDNLKGSEVFKAPEAVPLEMARAPVDLRKRVEHQAVKKDEEAVYVSLDTDDPKFKDYIEKIKRRILSVWRYPHDARPGLTGRVSLEFSIERDGSVSKIYVLSSSGHNPLDEGAINAINRASPFPPVPSSLLVGNKRRLAIDGHFKYN